jgi:prevent-host-death family protein
MSPKVLPTSEVRNRFAEVLKTIRHEGKYCLVTKGGHAIAALLSIEMYEDIMDQLEDRLDERDETLAKEVALARREYQKGMAKRIK